LYIPLQLKRHHPIKTICKHIGKTYICIRLIYINVPIVLKTAIWIVGSIPFLIKTYLSIEVMSVFFFIILLSFVFCLCLLWYDNSMFWKLKKDLNRLERSTIDANSSIILKCVLNLQLVSCSMLGKQIALKCVYYTFQYVALTLYQKRIMNRFNDCWHKQIN